MTSFNWTLSSDFNLFYNVLEGQQNRTWVFKGLIGRR